MIVTVDILKKINAAVASGKLLTIRQVADACYLDVKILELIVGDVEKPLTSMGVFFRLLESYLSELHKRVKMLNECYTAIQKLQIDNGIISASPEMKDPPIIW